MLDIERELAALIEAFDVAKVPYAICGALALAAHGHPRATKDIDLIVPESSVAAAKAVARACGFTLQALPFHFSQSGIHMERVSKIDGADLLMLDILIAGTELAEVWSSRVEMPWREGRLWCVSREGLLSMKLAAGRPQDLADIARLAEGA